MKVYAVINADQRGSRRSVDRVPDALAALAGVDGLVLGFERTAGDEVQGLAADAVTVVEVVERLARLDAAGDRGWRIGIGLGHVDDLGGIGSTREARGEAYVRAREAVERAGRAPSRICVVGAARAYAEDALVVLRALLDRRTPKGWEVVDALRAAGGEDAVQSVVAETLGVTESAVSQRLERATWRESQRAAALVRHHLGEELGESDG
ncbi:hypothetical protein GCM10027418_03850 [Mariniluteicoccus endophyticus]